MEALWTQSEKEGKRSLSLKSMETNREDNALKELVRSNLISLSREHAHLTGEGFPEAEKVVRRHRLAERLLVDVLDVEDHAVEEAACEFEHVIKSGIEENICVLLGHPRVCPHGNPIPRGKCCQRDYDKTSRIVVALSQLEPNQEGRIAYIHTRESERLQKLMAMGVTPGMLVRAIQNFPSHVFQIGQTQIAVDRDIANEIHVLRTNC